MDNYQSEYEKRIANPGLYLDSVESQKRREKAFNDPAYRQKLKEDMLFNPELKQREKEYLRNNPGSQDIFGVLEESKRR